MTRKPHTRTPEEFRHWLYANGITVTQWAREHDVKRTTVNDLLRGRTHGRYGESHDAAVAMGLKANPKEAA